MITYRPVDYASYDDKAQILRLYREVFHVNFAEGYHTWFCTEDRRPLGIAAIDKDTGKMVGHWACVRFCAAIGGKVAPFRLSLGTMTDMVYRGKGIATELFRNLEQAILEEHDALFFMGFPNEMSYKMFVGRFGFTLYRNYHFVVLPRGRCRSMYEKMDASFRKDQTGSCLEANQLFHSKEYMNWRYYGEKYDIWQAKTGHVFISTRFMDKADILYWSEDAGSEELLDFASFLYMTQDVKRVTTWNSIPCLNDFPREDRDYHMCVNHLNCSPAECAEIQRDWRFYMGDCELF